MDAKGIRIVGFIPARAASTRFPGKPLADIHGKPMVVRVLERAKLSPMLDDLYVVTDSPEILDAVEKFGGQALMTDTSHASGTDRIAQAVRDLALDESDLAINIQGDQPLFETRMIEEVVSPLLDDPNIPMSTLIYKIVREEEVTHPNAVKTVFDNRGFAIYFSRSTIPGFKQDDPSEIYYKHHGIYAYRCDFLQVFTSLPKGSLERAERLEQLRALEHGFKIRVVITEYDSIEVDTKEDLERVRRHYENAGV